MKYGIVVYKKFWTLIKLAHKRFLVLFLVQNCREKIYIKHLTQNIFFKYNKIHFFKKELMEKISNRTVFFKGGKKKGARSQTTCIIKISDQTG